MYISNDLVIILLLLLFYFDDMLIFGKDMSTIDRLKKELSEPFAMKDMRPIKQILGMQIFYDKKNISIMY